MAETATTAETKVRNALKVLAESDKGFTGTSLTDLIDFARLDHNPKLTWPMLSQESNELHLYPVILLAWIEISLSRAGKYATDPPRSGGGFSSDGMARSNPHLKIVEELRKRYDTYIEEHGLDRGVEETIQITTLVRRDKITGRMEPDGQQLYPPTLDVSVTLDGASVVLNWGIPNITDFSRYRVYQDTTKGIEDVSTIQDESNDNPGVREPLESIKDLNQQWMPAYRVSSLAPDTYYWIVMLEDVNGRVKASNEVVATVV